MGDAEAKELENGERLAKVEQKVDNIERIANKIDNNFETFTNIFVPRTELTLMFNSRDEKITDIQDDLKEKADKSEITTVEDKIDRTREEKRDWKKSLPVWIASVTGIAALLVSILTYITLTT